MPKRPLSMGFGHRSNVTRNGRDGSLAFCVDALTVAVQRKPTSAQAQDLYKEMGGIVVAISRPADILEQEKSDFKER